MSAITSAKLFLCSLWYRYECPLSFLVLIIHGFFNYSGEGLLNFIDHLQEPDFRFIDFLFLFPVFNVFQFVLQLLFLLIHFGVNFLIYIVC